MTSTWSLPERSRLAMPWMFVVNFFNKVAFLYKCKCDQHMHTDTHTQAWTGPNQYAPSFFSNGGINVTLVVTIDSIYYVQDNGY